MYKKLILGAALISAMHGVEPKTIWESEPVFKVPESVILDNSSNLLYVANINGKPTNKDGNGFISKVGIDGEIKSLEFATGLDAPKGMAIQNNTMYVSDIDKLRVIDLSDGKITKSYHIKEAKFLNDVVIDSNGVVYVSDFSPKNKAIYKIANGKVTKWLNEINLLGQRPNGLWIENENLVIGTKEGSIFKADYKTKKVKVYKEHIGVNGIDGILPYDDHNYITSDWAGRVFISDQKTSIKILDGSKEKVNAADIWYDQKSNRLYVPTFFNNRVLSYELK
jgi:sugar lactone lactonase YvrE